MKFKNLIFLWAGLALASHSMAEWDPMKAIQATGYQVPQDVLKRSVLAPWQENITSGSLNRNRDKMLVTRSDGLEPISSLGKSHEILGGIAIDMVAIRARNFTIRSSEGLLVLDVKSGKQVVINVPKGMGISSASWSPTGDKIGFIGSTESETYFCVANPVTGVVSTVGPNLRLVGVTDFEWLNDGSSVSAVIPVASQMVKRNQGFSPLVRTSDDKIDPLRTYAGLLNSEEDSQLLEDCLTGQPIILDLESKRVRFVGKSGMVRSLNVAPDGSAAIISMYEKPFSYLHPASQAPSRTKLVGLDGKEILELDFRPGPGAGRRGGNSKPTSPRGHTWDPFGRGLLYLQMEEQSKEDKDKKPLDQLILWKAPYGDSDKTVLYSQIDRIGTYQYSDNGNWLFMNQTIDGKSKQIAIEISTNKSFVISEPGKDAFYDDPGRLETTNGQATGRVVMTSSDGSFVYLSGTRFDKDYLKNAPRPFVDKVEIRTGKKVRVFESSDKKFESVDALDKDYSMRLIKRESSSEVPQYFFADGNSEKQITNNQDYNPLITQARTEVLKVTRADGVTFQVKATLPPYTTSISKRPAFFWFYPNEFADQKKYDEGLRSENINRFRTPSASSPNHFLNLGYVVIDNDCPIIGPDTAPNDLYTHQLRMNLSATIDALANEGWIDRDRLAIGGHSYGAFSTANAMIQTPFFKAGIAGDGNYNRSLTPFGFQSEPRSLWQAREMYQDVSALWNAEKLNGALLMYHGMQDQNMGTDPQHSRNLFQVLESLGKVSSLYMYPYEDHGQIAKETRLDMWARWSAWLEVYVNNPEKYKSRPEEKPKEGGNAGEELMTIVPEVSIRSNFDKIIWQDHASE